MVLTDTGFRSRAVSLLHSTSPFRNPEPGTPETTNDTASTSNPSPLNEKSRDNGGLSRDQSLSTSNEKTLTPSTDDAISQNRAAQRLVRTVPAWVHSLEDDDEEDEDVNSNLLPKTPPDAQIAQHNSNPSSKNKHKHEFGRLHDADRDWAPPTPRANVTETTSTWKVFADTSAYPPLPPGRGQRVTEEWLMQNGADYSQPWRASLVDDDPEKVGGRRRRKAKQRAWWQRVQRVILRNPIVPLVVRMIVWFFSLIALTLGGLIYHKRYLNKVEQETSPEMAIIVDAVALVYILYITYDEYTGKPLGLRSANAKMRLIFLDLFFIVFDSANLSLAFQALSDLSVICPLGDPVCAQQRALASVLLIALIAWLLAFSISVLRLVERVSGTIE